jgi:hypothetical protein
MRPLLALLALSFLAPPALGGVVQVDPFTQVVETSRFRLLFDFDRPEYLRSLVYKDFHPLRDIAGDEGQAREFWGQTLRGVNQPGFVQNASLESHAWEVVDDFGLGASVRVTSTSAGQPPVTTLYTFLADQPWFVVERTVHFSAVPDSAACQLYAARVDFVNPYRALRWRDVSGAYVQRGYCYAGCETPSWDGRWLEHVNTSNTGGFSVAQIYPATVPPGTRIVRGFGPESYSGWVARQYPAGLRTEDLTERVMVAFSTVAGDTTALDSLWTLFNSGAWTLDAPAPPLPARLRLAASPNPAAGPTRFAWTLPAAARVRLEVLDVAGRRVALPVAAELPAGEHAFAWDGRGSDGRRVAAGVYLARLVTPGGVATARVARVR